MWCLSSQVTWKAIWILFKITCLIIQVVLCRGKESDLSPWQLQSPPPLPSGYNRAILGSTSAVWTWEHADGSWEDVWLDTAWWRRKPEAGYDPGLVQTVTGSWWHSTDVAQRRGTTFQGPECDWKENGFRIQSARVAIPPLTQALTGHLTLPSLSFHICRVEIIIAPPFKSYGDN